MASEEIGKFVDLLSEARDNAETQRRLLTEARDEADES